jgi:predicted CoA-binding protein
MNHDELYGSPVVIDEVLAMHLWFVVGLGDNPERVAHHVAHRLIAQGKTVVPIHPRAEIVHGQPGYRTIAEAAAVHGAPDVVDVFVRSSRAGEFADQAIVEGAKAVWFQLGVSDESAAQRALDAGMLMVMDTCPLIEWRRRGVDV